MRKPIVLIPEPIAESGLRRLREPCTIVQPPAGSTAIPDAEMARVEGVILRIVPGDRAFMDRAPNLKVIARHGVGTDTVDIPEATRRGIAVTNTPQANYRAVAEHAVHLMLGVSRRVVAADGMVRSNEFRRRLELVGYELTDKTIGIIGLGRIGNRVAEICANGFSMTVLGYDPALNPSTYTGPAELCPTVDALLPRVDILSLHAPNTPETQGLLDADRLAAMQRGAVVINTARGSLIDATALAAALKSGHIAGAGLDVFPEEPPAPDSPLLTAPNTLVSPHVASSTREALNRMAEDSAQAVIDVLGGRRPDAVCNPQIWD